MRTRNAFFFSRKEQTAQCLWSRHVKRKLCRRIQSSSTSNSMSVGKLCLKSARKQGFPSTKNGPLQGMLRLQLLPGWRYDLWKQAAQALLLKRRCGKGEWDWKDGWWVTHTHPPLMSRLCFPTVKWKHQRKHHFFLLAPFQRLQKDTQSFAMRAGRSTPIAYHIIHTSLWDLQAGWLCLSGIGLCQCYQIAGIQRQWISVLLKTRKNTIRTMYVTLISIDDMGGYVTKDQRINKELLPHAPFALNW